MARQWVVVAAALTLGAGPPAQERVVTGDFVVTARVNGQPARLRIDPGALAMPMLGADLARRAELEGGRLDPGYAFAVGGTQIAGHTAVGAIQLDGPVFARRMGWNERRYQADVDGVLGPGSLREPAVRFQLRATRPGQWTRALPLLGGDTPDEQGPSYAVMPLAGIPLRIRFSPLVARSFLDATTANRIATGYGAKFTGAAAAEVIGFGVARPVRPMTLAHPLAIGPLSLTRVGVRIAEGRDTGAIPDANTPPPPVDPDEVVVTARVDRHPRPGTLTLGADALSRCSAVVFDKAAREVRLTCG